MGKTLRHTPSDWGKLWDILRLTDLVPPQPVFVVAREAVDHDGDGEGQDEDAAEGTEAAYQLAREGGGGQLPVAENEDC